MSVVDFLLELRDRQVHLFRDGDRLGCRAPKGVLDASLRAAIAERKEALLRILGDEPLPLPQSGDPDRRRPLSFAQQRLWFLHQVDPGGAQYNMPFAYRLSGPLDTAALQTALDGVVQRHESLRTTFGEDDGRPWQRIVECAVELREVDFRAPAVPLEDQLRREAGRPFDLRREPPFRATLFRTGWSEWVLLLVVHHIAADGWSFALVNRELAELYAAARTGVAPDLPPVTARYADFAEWQRSYLQGPALERLIRYWHHRLDGLPRLDIPCDEPEVATGTLAGSSVVRTVTDDLRAGMRALCASEQVTLFMLLLAAYSIVLSRHCGQERFPVGAIVANRNRTELEGVVGFFANIIAIPVELRPALTFRELLRRVRATAIESLEHQDLPFERVVEAVRAERTATGIPLVPAVLSVHNAALASCALHGVDTEWLPLDLGSVRFDLSLEAWDFAEQLRLQLHYRRDVLARPTAERLLARLVVLLQAAVGDPDRPLSALPAFDEAERDLLLEAWNDTRVESAGHACIHDDFARRAEREPERTAVELEDQRWSYGELARRVRTLAHALRAAGVGVETPVGICLERSPAMVAAMLAVLTAGGAYVPLDPRYPRERIRMIVDDARIAVVLCDSVSSAVLPGDVRRVILDRDAVCDLPAPAAVPHLPFPDVPPDAACVIYYTSGTTGRPKGAVLSHRSVRNYLHWISGVLRDEGVESVPVVSSLNSDATLKQILAPLLRGGTIWMLPQDTVLQPSRLLAALATRPNVAFNCVPTLWKAILETLEAPPRMPFRALLIGGEELTADLLRRTAARFPEMPVLNLYGPTETTANSSWDRLLPGQPVTIGRPVANTTIHLLGRDGEPVPTGAVGEICIGGAGVARGYLGRPALTAERFVPDPWSTGGRLYRTGDLGRRRPDGRIEFRGRADQQVQIRGFRVEPREVAAVLESHPVVADAVVTMRGDAARPRSWVAYATVRRDALHAELDPDGPWSRDDATAPVRALPSVEVLLRTLDHNVPAEGELVLRGIRSLPLLHVSHFSRRLAEADETTAAGEVVRVSRNDAAYDHELLIAPELFHRLASRYPSLAAVELDPAGAFTYDVVLRFGGPSRERIREVCWGEGGLEHQDALRDLLARTERVPLRIRRIPNAAVEPELIALETAREQGAVAAGELRRRMRAIGVDGAALAALGERLGWSAWVSLTPSGRRGELDCVFAPQGIDPRRFAEVAAVEPRPWSAYASEPLLRRIRAAYAPALRDHVARTLPDYMVPSTVVLLPSFPLTPNGKIDVAALPDPEVAASALAAPRTAAEETLCAIWQEVLCLDRVGVDDNFFQIGGDSILSLQMIARAHRAGLHITPRDVLTAQTVGALAAVAGARERVPPPLEEPSAGAAFPLTPIQQRFFDLDLAEPHHFNQAVLLEVGPRWSRALLADAVARVVAHHEAFRLRFARDRAGRWRQGIGGALPELEVAHVDDAGLPDLVAATHRRLDFTRGPLARFLFCDRGPELAPLLLIVIHHLIVDGVSWRILLEDLRNGPPPALPTPYCAWAEALARSARSDAVAAEAGHWLAVAEARSVELPRRAAGGENLEGRSAALELEVDAGTTAALFGQAAEAYGARVLDLLVTALAHAVESAAGPGPLKVTLEGHGRGVPPGMHDAPDVSLTVGWFTAVFPALVDLRGARDPQAAVAAVREQLGAVPHGGQGYGILRYLHGDDALRARLAAGPRPEINFNYLGRFRSHAGVLGFRPSAVSVEPVRSPLGLRRHLIDLDVLEFEGRLRMSCRYAADFFDAELVETVARRWADALQTIVAHSESIALQRRSSVRESH